MPGRSGASKLARHRARREARLGSGARFKSLSAKLGKRGAKDPDALAAYIGRKVHGKEKFQALAAAGRKS